MKAILLAGATSLALTGCALLQGETGAFLESDPTRDLIAACGAISGAVNVLTVNKHRLSDAQISVVDHVVDTAEPTCGADEPPVSNLALIEQLATQVASIQIGE